MQRLRAVRELADAGVDAEPVVYEDDVIDALVSFDDLMGDTTDCPTDVVCRHHRDRGRS